MLDKVDRRNKVSILFGLIFSALLKKYLYSFMFDLSVNRLDALSRIFDTVFDVVLSAAMIFIVYLIYPVFIKKKQE